MSYGKSVQRSNTLSNESKTRVNHYKINIENINESVLFLFQLFSPSLYRANNSDLESKLTVHTSNEYNNSKRFLRQKERAKKENETVSEAIVHKLIEPFIS